MLTPELLFVVYDNADIDCKLQLLRQFPYLFTNKSKKIEDIKKLLLSQFKTNNIDDKLKILQKYPILYKHFYNKVINILSTNDVKFNNKCLRSVLWHLYKYRSIKDKINIILQNYYLYIDIIYNKTPDISLYRSHDKPIKLCGAVNKNGLICEKTTSAKSIFCFYHKNYRNSTEVSIYN